MLEETNAAAMILPGYQFNRLEIDCSMNVISGAINGEVIISVSDETYGSGLSYIGVGNYLEFPDTLFAVYDNLSVIDQGDLALIPAETTTTTTAATSDPEAGLVTAVDFILANSPTSGPFSGSSDLAHGDFQNINAGVQVSEFYTEAGFVTPTGPPAGLWSVGLCFWVDPQGNCYEAYIVSDGVTARWDFGYSESTGLFESFAAGDVINLDLQPGAPNYIGLYVSGSSGILTINSYSPEGIFEIPAPAQNGDIELRIGFAADNPAETATIPMETFDFVVWDLAGPSTAAAQPTVAADPTVVAAPTLAAEPTVAASTDPSSFVQQKAQAMASASLAGPFQDTLAQQPGILDQDLSGISAADVYVTATFSVPLDTSQGWDFGIGVRQQPDFTGFRIILNSQGEWFQAFGLNAPFATGTTTALNTGAGQSNVVEVTAQGVNGHLVVNGVSVATLDLSQFLAAGDVIVGTGFFAGSGVAGITIPYSSFQVWSLPPGTADITSPFTLTPSEQIAGPYAGVLMEATNTINFAVAGVNVSDFFASAVFVVPTDAATPWDITIGFRHTSGNDQYRLTITSAGAWLFALGSAPPLASGTLTNLAATPGQENTIDLLVQGANAAVSLNGLDFATLDLSARSNPGDVWIASGSNAENTLPGRTPQYREFQVWSLA